MKAVMMKIALACMVVLTLMLVWVLLAMPLCHADDSDRMNAIVSIDIKPAVPTVSVWIDSYDGAGLDYNTVISMGCAEGAKQALMLQKRDPLPGELDRIYAQCLYVSGAMF